MTQRPYRVGVHQFLILGALSQAPNGALSAKQLSDHLNSWHKYFSMSAVLYSLIQKGCVESSANENRFRITEYGKRAQVARMKNRPEVFLPLRIGATDGEER